MRLTKRLGLVIAVAVAPVVAVESFNAYSLVEQEQQKSQKLALEYAHHASWEMQRLLDGIRSTMRIIAFSPAVISADWSVCQQFLHNVSAGAPELIGISVADADGNLVCGQGTDTGFRIQGLPFFQRILAGEEFVVGDYTVGKLSNRRLLPLAVPVKSQQGKVQGAVVAALDLDWLSAGLSERGLPPEGSLTMADAQGTIIARQPLPERFVGTKIPDAYLHLVHEQTSGTLEVTSQDGTRRILGYKPVGAAPEGVYISAGLGADYSFSGVYTAALRALVVTVLAVLTAILASLFVSRRFISQPLARLVTTAERWRSGDLNARSNVKGDDEFGTLGEVFDKAIEQAKRREEKISILMREVTHRVKNQMAVMLSMARQVGKSTDTVEAFQRAFSDRIIAMARSHDLVFSASQDARLATLIENQLDPFSIASRVTAAGPDIWINAQCAQHIGMAIHELCTNAVKYGALSTSHGQVSISWSVTAAEPATLRIEWKESGGPKVTPRSRMGFGSTILESVVAPALGGWSELKFEPAGLIWICEFSGHFTASSPAPALVA